MSWEATMEKTLLGIGRLVESSNIKVLLQDLIILRNQNSDSFWQLWLEVDLHYGKN